MNDKSQNLDKIYLPSPSRFLSRDEFQDYISLVKIIANFDPQNKKWYLNERKLAITDKEMIRETVDRLKDYLGDIVYDVLSDYIKDKNNYVYGEIKGNYLIVYDDLSKYKELLTYKIKTFDHIQGQYIETPVLLAWQRQNNFATFRGLYWKLSTITNIKVKPFTNLQFHEIQLKNFEMRSYQINSIKAWINDINITGNGVIKAPTGSGKSVIAILSALEMLKNKSNAKIIYAVNSTTLLKQFQNFAKKEDLPFVLVSGEVNELQKGEKSDLIALSISYYYSQKKQNKNEKLKELISNADLVIVDEAHHTPANIVKSLLLDSPNSIRLGLSATPLREDGRELEIMGLLGKISFTIDYTELVQNRYLVPIEYISFEPKLSEKIEKKIKNIELMYTDSPFAKFYSALLRMFENSPYTNKQIIQKIISLNKYPALVIVRRIRHAELLSKMFDESGINADWVSSKTNLEERIQKIEALKNGKLQVLISTSLADEGLDIPNLRLVVLLSQGKSRIKLIQRIGRVMRPAKQKEKGYVLDINYAHEIFAKQKMKREKFVINEYSGIIQIR
ncbi:putative helicase [Betalipothrixvirus uzonense]|uniref:Putative helicase n=1 Tax=Betalipothrixvirus uzonense TaxID=512792 RepID=B2CRJ8_9VIRU|nr:putative helicase [Acidianus filamentous virus 9]ACB37255.1 putative helicase [Acidianus filamentous virus 9]